MSDQQTPTLDIDPTQYPGAQHPGAGVTWEFDIDNETIGGVTLAMLIFSSGAGQCSVSNFTPDALRAIADALYTHAHDMDGKGFFNHTGLKNMLAKAIPYIGVPQYAVPDGLVDACERPAGIDLPDDDQLIREFEGSHLPEGTA